MKTNNARDFDKDAATWDDNPARVAMTLKATAALLDRVPVTSDMSVFDFGAGTGLVTLVLAQKAGRVIAADGSAGMVARLSAKIASSGLANVTAIQLDLDADPLPPEKFDLAVSTMVLHHIPDARGTVAKLASLLRPEGTLAIADLDSDGGEFHPDPNGVHHNGFDRATMAAYFQGAGLINVSDCTALTFERDVPGKGKREFSIFLMTGLRK